MLRIDPTCWCRLRLLSTGHACLSSYLVIGQQAADKGQTETLYAWIASEGSVMCVGENNVVNTVERPAAAIRN